MYEKTEYPKEYGKHQTTIEIPIGMAKDIKDRGMTYTGAFLQGWKAINERKSWNEEIDSVQKNLDAYRLRMIKAEQRLRELGETQ